jgi:hypothetical protein
MQFGTLVIPTVQSCLASFVLLSINQSPVPNAIQTSFIYRYLLYILGEHVDGELVGGHHDCRVGDLSYQLSAQASATPIHKFMIIKLSPP